MSLIGHPYWVCSFGKFSSFNIDRVLSTPSVFLNFVFFLNYPVLVTTETSTSPVLGSRHSSEDCTGDRLSVVPVPVDWTVDVPRRLLTLLESPPKKTSRRFIIGSGLLWS